MNDDPQTMWKKIISPQITKSCLTSHYKIKLLHYHIGFSVSQNSCLRFNRTAVFPLDRIAGGGVESLSINESWAENRCAIVFPPLTMPGGGVERLGACRSLVSVYLFPARTGTRGSVIPNLFDYTYDLIPPYPPEGLSTRDRKRGLTRVIVWFF